MSDVDGDVHFETRRGSLGYGIKSDVHGARIVRLGANIGDAPFADSAILRCDCGILAGFQAGGQGGRDGHASD